MKDQGQKAFFNKMARTWDQERGTSGRKLNRVVRESELGPGQVVLDVGSGTGVLIPHILKKIGKTSRIYALDYAEKMVQEIRKKKFPRQVVPVVGDIHATPFPAEFFDRVVANACFPHFQDKKTALAEICRILKPGGLFIISVPRGRKWVNRHHRKFHPVAKDVIPSAPLMRRLLRSAGFVLEKLIDEKNFYLVACRKPAG